MRPAASRRRSRSGLNRSSLGVQLALVEAELGSVAQQAGDPGVRVLHVVDGIVVGALAHASRSRSIVLSVRVAAEGIATGIGADGLHQLLQRHRRPGPLAHPQRLAVLVEVDHLADEDLQVGVGIVPVGSRECLVPPDVAVVVCPEHDDDTVEATFALVEVVGSVGGEVGPLTVALDEDAILVVAERRRAQPGRLVLDVDVSALRQPCQCSRRARPCRASLSR